MIKTKDWTKICADCQEGKPPKDCEYYGEPRGCNAPTYGGPPPIYYAELREENARIRAAQKKLYLACHEMLRYYYEQNTNTTVFNTALELMKQAVAEASGESDVRQ